MKSIKNKGFTLVELSVVLVIIGLLIGGVLVGQSMISSARLTSAVKELGQYDALGQTFIGVYGTVPGDSRQFEPVASQRGNGRIDANGFELAAANSDEWIEFLLVWRQLAESQILTGQTFTIYSGGATFPGNFAGYAPKIGYGTNCYLNAATSDYSSVGAKDLGHHWIISSGASGSYVPCMTAREASALDGKLDNGLPVTGTVRVMYPYSGSNIAGHLGCMQAGGSEPYDLQGTWNAVTGLADSPSNPNRIECLMAVKNSWAN